MAIRFWWESWHIGKNESLGCFELNQVITRGIRNETDFMELWRAWNKKNPSGWIETTLTHHSQRVQQLRLWYEPRKIRNSLNGNLEHIDSAGRGLIIHVEGEFRELQEFALRIMGKNFIKKDEPRFYHWIRQT